MVGVGDVFSFFSRKKKGSNVGPSGQGDPAVPENPAPCSDASPASNPAETPPVQDSYTPSQNNPPEIPQPASSPQPETQSGIEAKVEKAETDRTFNGLLKTIKIENKFSDADFAANIIWECFSSKGKIKEIGERADSDKKIYGAPTMAKSDKGSFYPTNAVFRASVNGADYFVEFNSRYTGFSISVECDFKSRTFVEDIFSKAEKELVSITAHYDTRKPVILLYKLLVEKATKMKLLPLHFDEKPKMDFDDVHGLIPVEAKILAELGGIEFIFNISSPVREVITIDCPKDCVEFASEILKNLTPKRPVQEGEKEVKGLEFSVSVAEYHWGMVGGLGAVRDELLQYVEWPIENMELFKQLDTSIPKGVLLDGPPGNGKTTIAKIIANETKSAFYTVSPKDINSMWVGGTEKNWGLLFENARKDVDAGKTVIIFIDEIDGFFTSREEMDKYSRISFGQFCQEVDGISDLKNVILIAATNNYSILDPALVRPGRFAKRIYLGNPDAVGRKDILKIYTQKKPISPEVNIDYLVDQTEGFSGAQIKELCDSATFNAIQWYSTTNGISIKDITGEKIKEIKLGKVDFESALNALKARYSKKED